MSINVIGVDAYALGWVGVELRDGAFGRAMNRIYEIGEGRPFWKLRPIQILITLVAVLLIAIAAAGIWYWRAKSAAPRITSIAVLPFVNATADPNNEYLSDGLTESLISALSQLPDLKVMARSTVFRFKGKEDDPQSIGKSLQVAALLMGRISQHGDTMAVQADLVSTADGSELWGSHYERKLTEISFIFAGVGAAFAACRAFASVNSPSWRNFS